MSGLCKPLCKRRRVPSILVCPALVATAAGATKSHTLHSADAQRTEQKITSLSQLPRCHARHRPHRLEYGSVLCTPLDGEESTKGAVGRTATMADRTVSTNSCASGTSAFSAIL